MTEFYRKSLIKNIEENLRDFQSILLSLWQHKQELDEETAATFKEYFTTIMAIEEDVFEMRLKKIIDRENPYLPAIEPRRFKQENLYNEKSLGEIIERFFEQKRKIIKFLYNLPSHLWEKTGFHELEGHVTFEEFIRRMIRNDKLVLGQIRNKYIKIDKED